MSTLELRAGDYRVMLAPEFGGSVARFDWRGEPLFRPTCGASILDTACFPLVPFSNRIAFGRFTVDGRDVTLAPNFPGQDHPHTLHGFGWLEAWSVVEHGASHATLRHAYTAGEWPWDYVAEQTFRLSPSGLSHAINLRNLSKAPMPAGVGFHPYFPRTERTRYLGLHRGEWETAADGLPIALRNAAEAVDWWTGRPVGQRSVDTVYTERQGSLSIAWPDRGLGLTITPSDVLPFTVVYVPEGKDFICVEPVSHMTDAINRRSDGCGLRWLGRGEQLQAEVVYRASALSQDNP